MGFKRDIVFIIKIKLLVLYLVVIDKTLSGIE